MAHKKVSIQKEKVLHELEAYTGNTAMQDYSTHRLYTGKFRFQLFADWILRHMPKDNIADIGGGKGQLSYFLAKHGMCVTVIDPYPQALLRKYTDVYTKKRIFIPEGTTVSYIEKPFTSDLSQSFDLLVGLHAHGANVEIIDGAKKYNKSFLLVPCCVIDEPFYPIKGKTWLLSLADYAMREGFHITPFVVNFAGQNIGLYGTRP